VPGWHVCEYRVYGVEQRPAEGAANYLHQLRPCHVVPRPEGAVGITAHNLAVVGCLNVIIERAPRRNVAEVRASAGIYRELESQHHDLGHLPPRRVIERPECVVSIARDSSAAS